MPTESALEAVSILRHGSLFQWYVIPLFAIAGIVFGKLLPPDPRLKIVGWI